MKYFAYRRVKNRGEIGGIPEHKSILSVEKVRNIAIEYGINHRAIGSARLVERVRALQSSGHRSVREYDEGSVRRIGSLMLNVRELEESMLYAAALSPMPMERAGHLKYGGKRRWWSKRTMFIYVNKRCRNEGTPSNDVVML